MQILHVMTVHPDLPLPLLDHMLARVERALQTAGASRIWIDESLPPLGVMAELPAEVLEPATSWEALGPIPMAEP